MHVDTHFYNWLTYKNIFYWFRRPIDIIWSPEKVDRFSDYEDIDKNSRLDTATKDILGRIELYLPDNRRKYVWKLWNHIEKFF